MHLLLKILRILPPQEYSSFFLLSVVTFAGAVLETLGIGAIFPLLSAMGQKDFLAQHARLAEIVGEIGIHEHNEFIMLCAVCLILFYFLKNLFLAFKTHMQIRFTMRNQIFYSDQLLAEYLSRPYLFHLNNNTGLLLRNVNSGGMVVFGAIVLPLLSLISDIIMAVIIALLLIWVDPLIAIVGAGFFGSLVFLIIKSSHKRIARQGAIQMDCQTQLFRWANQSFGSIKETKIMHTERFFMEQYDASYQQFGKAMGSFQFLSQMPRLLIESAVVSGLLGLVFLKLLLGANAIEIISLLGLLALAAFRLMPSANHMVACYNGIKFQLPFFYEIYPELEAIHKRVVEGNLDVMPRMAKRLPFDKSIRIEHVTFSYNTGQEILRDIDFQIAKGDFVGIIGPSGAGKTTFVDVLLGLLPPSQGRILVDGVDIATNVRGWQENFAYVPQTIYLIDTSIRENIALGQAKEDIDDGKIEKVLHMAELYDYVQSLPNGLDTAVGELGGRLSGGQRQRIGIARALYRNPDILVLDEATSSLDNETEKSITDTILKLKGKMTIVSIAHRVSTLEQCDYKVKIQDGRCSIV